MKKPQNTYKKKILLNSYITKETKHCLFSRSFTLSTFRIHKCTNKNHLIPVILIETRFGDVIREEENFEKNNKISDRELLIELLEQNVKCKYM